MPVENLTIATDQTNSDDVLSASLAALVQERVASSEWRVVALMSDQAVKPIQTWLREEFEIDASKAVLLVMVTSEALA